MFAVRRLFVLLLLVLVSCASADQATVPPGERWRIGDYWVFVPPDWTFVEEADDNGFNVVEPPDGDGQILFLEIADDHVPATITEEYALEQAKRGFADMTLESGELEAAKRGTEHFSIAGEGSKVGRHVIQVVHVFRPAQIVLAQYHAADASDSYLPVAQQIIDSVTPVSD